MPKQAYKNIRFRSDSLELIERVNAIVTEYEDQGYELTLRQVYYQLVARGFIPNNERSYKNLGNLINDGRLAGLIDWNSVVDRTRFIRRNSHWSTPQSVINSARYSYMEKLCTALNCSVDELLTVDINEQTEENNPAKVVNGNE